VVSEPWLQARPKRLPLLLYRCLSSCSPLLPPFYHQQQEEKEKEKEKEKEEARKCCRQWQLLMLMWRGGFKLRAAL
jgi:hypothetical protein